MSIAMELGETAGITEGPQVHDLFVDRFELKHRFASYLNDDPPCEQILFLHGDGGNGKSMLLRHLKKHYCKRLRPADWQRLKALPDRAAVARGVTQTRSAVPVPSVLLDFNAPPCAEDRLQEAFSALLVLRRSLAEHRIRFPLYDFACVWYLHRRRQLTAERLRDLFPTEEVDLIAEIAHYLSEKPLVLVANAALGAFTKHLRERFAVYTRRRRLTHAQIEAIEAMEETELLEHLPIFMAQDLNVAMRVKRHYQRLVLFFDTHEVLWGTERDVLDHLYFRRDEWLRRLLTHVDLQQGIVAVVAGRDRPRWAEAGRFQIPEHYVDLRHVGHLSAADAAGYLQLAGVHDLRLREGLIAHTAADTNEVHPLLLGLCTSVVLRTIRDRLPSVEVQADHLAEPRREVMDRLLRYVGAEAGHAVAALSACPAFDRRTYFALARRLDFHASEPAFVELTRLSFVWPAPSCGDGWYRISDLLRRLHRECRNEVTRRAAGALRMDRSRRAHVG